MFNCYTLFSSTLNCDSAPRNYILWCHHVVSLGYNVIYHLLYRDLKGDLRQVPLFDFIGRH